MNLHCEIEKKDLFIKRAMHLRFVQAQILAVLVALLVIEQDTGIEPASSAWEANILPMY